MDQPQPPLSSTRRAFITAFTVAASTMHALDGTIANVALPHMQGTFSATQDQVAWVLTSYLVASAIGLTLTNVMAQRFGRMRLYVFAITAFTLASAMCGLAQSMSQIVLFRVLQGFLGGAILPLTQAVLVDIYPPDKRTTAMSYWGFGVLIGPILGPTLGGYLTDLYNWRWVFLINVPFGAIAAVGLAVTLPETERQPKHYFDGLGFILLTSAVVAFQIMLDRGETMDWFSSREIIVEAIVAGAGLYLFVVHMLTSDRPFISRALLQDTHYVTTVVLGALVTGSLYALSALMPLMLQSLMGYPPRAAGAIMAWRGVGALAGMGVVNYTTRAAPRATIVGGIGAMAIATWYMAGFTVDAAAWQVGVAAAMTGFGVALSWTPLNVISFDTISTKLTTEASGLASLMRSVFGSIGISASVSLLANNSQINHEVLTEHVTMFSRNLRDMVAHGLLTLNLPSELAILDSAINREAAMRAYVDDFVLLAWLMFALIPIVLLMRIGKLPVAPAEEAVPQEG